MATLLGSNEGSFSVDEKARRDGMWRWRTRQFSIEYTVLSDNLDESWLAVETMADMPHIGDRKDGCVCKGYKLKETNTCWVNGTPRFKWTIEYNYDSECGAEDSRNNKTGEDETNPDPITWPVEISWSSIKIKQAFPKDCSDPPRVIQNSAEESMPQEDDMVVPCLTLSRYEPYVWGPTWITQYTQTVNSDTFMGYEKGRCLIDEITADREEINGGYYFKVTYKILFHPLDDNPWDWHIADIGTKVFADDGTKIIPVAIARGYAGTVDLDGHGHERQKGDPKVFLTFYRYYRTKFADLHFNLAESPIPEN